MMFRRTLFAASCVSIVAACAPPQTSPAPQPKPAPQSNVFDPLTHDIERAKAVQGTVDAQSAHMREQVAAAEGSGDSAAH